MKAESYNKIQAQIDSILSEENSLIANLANTAAVLRAEFGYWWIGFYLVQGDELMLGPFQGPVACTRIQNGKAYVEQHGLIRLLLWCQMCTNLKDI